GVSVEDRAELPGGFRSPGEPVEVETEGVLQLPDAHSREAGGASGRSRPRRDAVDVAAGESGVGQRGEDGLDGERQRRPVEAPPDRRLTHPADDDGWRAA